MNDTRIKWAKQLQRVFDSVPAGIDIMFSVDARVTVRVLAKEVGDVAHQDDRTTGGMTVRRFMNS